MFCKSMICQIWLEGEKREEKTELKVNDFFAIIAFYLSGHMKENYGDYLHGRNLCDRVYSKLEFEVSYFLGSHEIFVFQLLDALTYQISLRIIGMLANIGYICKATNSL